MKCIKETTEFSKAAGRDVTTCREFDGAASSTLGGFNWTPAGLHWAWGAVAGAGTSLLAGRVASSVDTYATAPSEEERLRNVLLGGIGVPAVIGGIMVAIKRTRTAGWATIGAGLAAGIGQYVYEKVSTGQSIMGVVTANQQMYGAPVKILGGGSPMGLPVAESVTMGRAPLQVLGGAEAPVSILGGFGSGFGTNFANQK